MPESSSPFPRPEDPVDVALELPTAPDFVSRPPILPFDDVVAMCEELLPFEIGRPDFEERRLRIKVGEEFVL